ncbi:MAG: hypothetical protein IKI02_07740 [Oscillospiraceae bacterium]|nr:hypothetical protein [Oscillospiraceae bacterium]
MKSDKFTKAVVIVLFCVVASYLIFSVTRFSGDSFTTYKAVRYEVGDGITTSGFLVRSEQALTAGSAELVVPVRDEGEKVGRGQTVAATYRDEAARSRQARIEALEEELAQMRYAHSFSGSDLDSATLDNDIQRQMNEVTLLAARREFSAADKAAEALKPYVLRRYLNSADAEALWTRIRSAEATLNELRAEAEAESGSIAAPVSGWFSGVADGYEAELTPEFLETARVTELEHYNGIGRRETGAFGKLVTGQKWYFAAVVPAVNVETLEIGDRVDASFAYDFYETVPMRVERVSDPEDGRRVLVLSCESYIQSAVSSRIQSADLVFSNLSGLRVPKTAIYVTEGSSGVYVLEGAEAKWKPIEILCDNGDSFIVKLDKTSTKNLWPEDEIILTTGEIFNGKVMVK